MDLKSLTLRIILTVAGLISIFIDSYNETVLFDDGRIHIVTDIYKVVAIIAIWFI